MAKAIGGIRDHVQGRTDVFLIDPHRLNIREGFNLRDLSTPDNVEHIEQLAASIAEVGVREPLTVWWEDGKAWVSNGHCRHAAVMLCISRGVQIATGPVRTGGRGEGEADRVVDQIVRNSGKRPSPIEMARAVKKLVDLGWDEAKIASQIGMTPGWVRQLLDLHAAPEDVKAAVSGGEVSATTVIRARRQGKTEELRGALKEARTTGAKRVTPKAIEPRPAAAAGHFERGEVAALLRASFVEGWSKRHAISGPAAWARMEAEANAYVSKIMKGEGDGGE